MKNTDNPNIAGSTCKVIASDSVNINDDLSIPDSVQQKTISELINEKKQKQEETR